MATLYLMLGYPGSGKTTTAKILRELTGATHLWADQERRKRFDPPTYSHAENLELYAELNQVAADLLEQGESVIFDTNFNFYKDRRKLRQIAANRGADARLLWVTTPKEIARERAVDSQQHSATRVLGDMPPEKFDRMASNLQPPRPDEAYTAIDGTKITAEYLKQLLDL